MKLTHEITEGGRRKQATILALAALVLTAAAIGVVVAQSPSEGTFTDDFEDGTAADWVNEETGVTAETSSMAVDGETSLYANTSMVSGASDQATLEWTNGPELNTSEDFDASGIIHPDLEEGGADIRIGISGPDQNAEGENAFLRFHTNRTFLATSIDEGATQELPSFDDTWVRWRMQSDNNSSELRAKVWEYGTPEPSEWQLTRNDFDNVEPGYFGVNPGLNPPSGSRQIYLDSIRIEGTPVEPEPDTDALELDAPVLVQPGDNGSYVVRHFGENNRSQIVTDEATVTSGNVSVLTVDESSHRLEATDDINVSQRVNVTAEYEGESTTAIVAVAEPTVENMEVLPTLWAFSALLDDGTVFALILCTFFAVVATWAATPFAGIGAFQLGVTMGWFGGWIPGGIMMVGLFASLFIGFNLAANIDYTVRR